MEIERKYRIKTIPFDLNYFEKIIIKQTYISTDPVLRIRQSNQDFILTIKGSGSIMREEYELPLSEAQFERLRMKAETKTIEKVRYKIPLENGLIAELDLYEGELEGLLTVEVEFETLEEAETFKAPHWFAEDISLDNRYKNSSLAQYGLPEAFSRTAYTHK